MSYSAWLDNTVRKEFTIRADLKAISSYEDEHGSFTPEELAEADEWAAQAIRRASDPAAAPGRRTA